MSNPTTWTCDHTKNKAGDPFNPAIDPSMYLPEENYGSVCNLCGMSKQEHDQKGTSKTIKLPNTNLPLKNIGIGAAVAVVVLFGGLAWANKDKVDFCIIPSQCVPDPDSDQLVSESANNPAIFSQGEKLFLTATPDKEDGATAFAAKDWATATTSYEQAFNANRNDPEARIYHNNAKARQAGNPLTVAMVLPISTDINTAQEMLRGAAIYQDSFNKSSQGGRLLELVLVEDSGQVNDADIASDLANASNVLGVLGHGASQETEEALAIYAAETVPVVSPMNAEITAGTAEESILRTVPTAQKAQALLQDYLLAMNRSFLEYTATQHPNPKIVLVTNSSESYSLQQQQAFETVIPTTNAEIIETVDIATTSDFFSILTNASQQGANTLLIALPKEDVAFAIELLKANQNLPSPLTTLGIDALYSPEVLTSAQDAVENLVVAVPWRYETNLPFAQEAEQMWQGRINWRTVVVNDLLQALVTAVNEAPQRPDAKQLLDQGVEVRGTNTDFDLLLKVPLVQAIPGTAGPTGAKHQFEPIDPN